MKLNHVNLTVTDVDAASAFLEEYFDLEVRGVDGTMAFLFDEDGLVLTLMAVRGDGGLEYPGTFHVGFFVEDEALVEETHRRLEAADHDVTSLAERHHSYGFYVEAPGGFTVEMGA